MEKGPLAPLLAQLQEVQLEERRGLLRGRALRHLGREGEAQEVLRDVIAKAPAYVEAWQELSELLLERG